MHQLPPKQPPRVVAQLKNIYAADDSGASSAADAAESLTPGEQVWVSIKGERYRGLTLSPHEKDQHQWHVKLDRTLRVPTASSVRSEYFVWSDVTVFTRAKLVLLDAEILHKITSMRGEQSVAECFNGAMGYGEQSRKLVDKRVMETWLYWRLLNSLDELEALGTYCLPSCRGWLDRALGDNDRRIQDHNTR